MSERKISKRLVEGAVLKPDALLDAGLGRKQAVLKIGKDVVSVIYVKENNLYVVITVYWGE